MKLEGAQKQNCCLAGQPSQVIEVLRDIVTRIRRNLTQADRDKNNQNRRDTKKLRKSMPYQENKNPKSPLPSKLLEIKGAVGTPKVTMDEASIKALKKIEEYAQASRQCKNNWKNSNYVKLLPPLIKNDMRGKDFSSTVKRQSSMALMYRKSVMNYFMDNQATITV
jgi:hypothetical protein